MDDVTDMQEVRFSGAAYCGPCLAPLMEALLCAEDSNPAIIRAVSAAGDAASGWGTAPSVVHVALAAAADSLLVAA